MRRTRVLIVGDHPLFCEGLRAVLEDQRSIRVVGIAADTPKAVEEVKALQPDVVIVDGNASCVPIERLFAQAEQDIRIVHVTLDNNRAAVYSRESLEDFSTTGLVAAIVRSSGRRGLAEAKRAPF